MAQSWHRFEFFPAGAAIVMVASAVFLVAPGVGFGGDVPRDDIVADAPHADDDAMATARAVAWLVAQQQDDGGFAVRGDDASGARRLATSCVALHALAHEAGAPNDAVERALQYVLGHVDDGGWVGSGRSGLAWRVTGAAAGALRAALARDATWCTEARVRTLQTLELSTVTNAPESWRDAQRARSAAVAPDDVARTLAEAGDSDAAGRAVAFLKRVSGDVSAPVALPGGVLAREASANGFSYDDLLQLTHRPQFAPDDSILRRAIGAVQASFTVTRNPDLAGRFPASTEAGGAGRFHYLLIAARVLAHTGTPRYVDAEGRVVEWAAEMRRQLLAEQDADGAWRNRDGGRWWEDDPVLTTAFALRALQYCDLVAE